MSLGKLNVWLIVKGVFGFPSLSSFKEFFFLLWKMRLMIWLYLALIYTYYHWFYQCKSQTILWLTKLFGKDFGISFSASLLEDLVMFIFLTFVITVFSIKLSLTKPADYEFDDRIRAIMNSKRVAFDKKVFDFLKKEISLLLAYNKLVQIHVEVTDFFPLENCFQFVHTRHQIITNMCKDKDFVSSGSKISVYSHAKHGVSYGKLYLLEEIDPNNFNTRIRDIIDAPAGTDLNEGENPIPLPYTIGSDNEFAYKLKYHVYTTHELGKDWSYSAAFRYTTKMAFRLTNKLSDGKKIKINFRRRNIADGKAIPIDTEYELKPGESYTHDEYTPFVEDDQIEYFVHTPYN